MNHLFLSFSSGIVRPMLATHTRPGVFGKYPQEAVERCKAMGMTAKVIDKETYKVIGEVAFIGTNYRYLATESLDETA